MSGVKASRAFADAVWVTYVQALSRFLGRWTSAMAATIVVLGVVASLTAGDYANRVGQDESQAMLDRRAARTTAALQQEIMRYQDTVTLLAASLGAQKDFDAADFEFVTAPLARARLAGASGASFIAAADPDRAAEVSSFWQARGSVPLEPKGEGEHYFIVFSTTLDGATTNSRGRDLAEAAQPARALKQARESGAPAVSDTYKLLRDQQLPEDQRQPSIVIAAPVYGAPGTAGAGRFRGWALMGMRTGDAARAVVSSAGRDATNVTLSITDSTGVSARAMQVVAGPAAPGGRSSQARFQLGEQWWQISATHTVAGDNVATTYGRLAQVIAAGGSALSVLLGGICWLLVSGRRRALARVESATAELRATGVELAGAEAAARNQAGLLNAILDSIGDGVGVVDARGKFLLHNPAAKVMLAVGDDLDDPARWSGHYGLYLSDGATPFPAEDLPLTRAMRGENVDQVDMVIRNPDRPDGTTVSVSARALDPAAGVPGGAVAIFRDVTQRRCNEAALARSEAAYALAFEGSMIGMSVTDLHGVFVRVNQAFADIVGCAREDLVGTRSCALDHPEDDPGLVERLDAEALAGRREGFTLRKRFVRADGTVGHAEMSSALVRDADGDPLHFTNQVVDVTAERAAAAEREAAAAAIAAAATATAEAKTAFLATMSHEIRTPLNGVLGLLTLLQGSDLDPDQQVWAHGAATSGRALLAIVNDVLDASKIEAGAIRLESIEFDLLAVVDEALTPSRATAADKDVHLVTAPARGLTGSRIGDPTRLRQVITNLVSNAVKFTDHGTVTVRIAGSDRRVQLVVSDTGIGISAAAQEHLFTPYAQAEASTTRTFGGTGLGLSIVSGIVAAMNGTITATSVPGVGTTFEVDLPMLALTSSRTPRPAPPQPRQTEPAGAGAMLHVLVAEDNEINQIVAKATLEKHAMVVDVVADGAAAIEAVASGNYDAVFMDCQMPGVDGLEATRRIRAVQRARTGPARRRTPIIAMTAGAFDADRAACTDAGMDAFLPKPWTTQQLAEVLVMVRAATGGTAPTSGEDAPAHVGPSSQLESVRARLDELFEDGGRAVAAPMRQRLVDSFLTRTPPLLTELAEAAAHHDEQSVAKIAHTLRGLAGNLGATTLAHLAATLDGGADAPCPTGTDVDQRVADLAAAFDHLAAGLAPLSAGPPAPPRGPARGAPAATCSTAAPRPVLPG